MRTCPGCHRSLEDDAFAKSQFRCRECKAAACRSWRQRHPDRQRASSNRWVERVGYRTKPETHRRHAALYRARHPERVRARLKMNAALRAGRLVKPTACTACGAAGRIEAHHHDYSRPLDVRWLCIRCHKAHHQEIAP